MLWGCFNIRGFETLRVFTNLDARMTIKLYERGLLKVCETLV